MEKHVQSWVAAGIFALLATLLSGFQIHQHMKQNTNPVMRRCVIRILGMVPMYCIESWFGLRFQDYYLFFDLLRNCYEALVIYSFFQLLVEYLGGEQHLQELLRDKTQQNHVAPFCCLSDWKMGYEFYLKTKIGILQYVAFNPLTALISMILKLTGHYCDGEFVAKCGYPYLAFITNMSQIWALYCLVMFYYVSRENLAPMKPVAKFLCIKLVVFATFWQSVMIALLVEVEIIVPTETFTSDNIATMLQDFIICVEMFVAALAHMYAFKIRDFKTAHVEPGMPTVPPAPVTRFEYLKDAVNISDIARDINDHIIPDGAKNLHEKIPDVRKVFVRGRGSSANYTGLEDQNIHLLGDMELRDTSSVKFNDEAADADGSGSGSHSDGSKRSPSMDSRRGSSASASSSASPTNHSRLHPRGLLRRAKYGKLPPTFEDDDEYVTSSPFREKDDEVAEQPQQQQSASPSSGRSDAATAERNPESAASSVAVRNPEARSDSASPSPDAQANSSRSGGSAKDAEKQV